MSSAKTFGSYIVEKRMERQITAREFSKRIKLSPVYVCDVEKDRRAAPRAEILNRMAVALSLNSKESGIFYDLAAQSTNTVSADLIEYIMKNDIVRKAIRTAKERGIDMKMWQDFIDQINNCYNNTHVLSL